jgi:hypothetical protein
MMKIPEIDLIKLNQVEDISKSSILFILPGIEGNCDALAELASLLSSKNIQVYGLEFSKNAPEDSVEHAASYFLHLIQAEMKKLNRDRFFLGGYSFGGLLAIEMCHQLKKDPTRYKNLHIECLIMFETSHIFFRRSVHAISKTYNICIPHKSIFDDVRIYPGSLSVYLGFLIGHSNRKFRFGLYDHLQSQEVRNLEDALDKSFKYIAENGFYTFADNTELDQMREYLRHMLVKSNAAFLYEFDSKSKPKLAVKCCLIKSKDFLYRSNRDLYFMNEKNERERFDLNEDDFNLRDILESESELKVYECENGNHWTFISENLEFISNIISDLVSQNSIVISKL